MRVAVLGGGAAGLAAALSVQRRALRENRLVQLRLLEAEPRLGGHVGTIREAGFLVEMGPNGFLTGLPAAEELIRYAGLDSSMIEARPVSRRRFLALQGRLRQVPATPLHLFITRSLSLRGRVRVALEPWIPARRGDRDEETVFEWSRRRFGSEAAEVFADAIVSGTSAGDARTVSIDAAYPVLPELERGHGSVVRGLLARRRTGAGLSRPRLVTFRDGMQSVADAIGQRLGAGVSVGAAVSTLTRDGGRWIVQQTRGEPLVADQVIAALPSSRTARLLENSAPALAAQLRSIPNSSLAVVVFAWRTADLARPLDGYGYLVPSQEGLRTLGVVWESSLFPGRAPAGSVLVRVMLGGARCPEIVGLPDAELFRLAESEAVPFLQAVRPPSRAWLFRWPESIPQYLKGHRDRLAGIRQAAGALGGLELCGSSYDGLSFTSAIASGVAAANRLALE